MDGREPRSVSEAVDALRLREQRTQLQQLQQQKENPYAKVGREWFEEFDVGVTEMSEFSVAPQRNRNEYTRCIAAANVLQGGVLATVVSITSMSQMLEQ